MKAFTFTELIRKDGQLVLYLATVLSVALAGYMRFSFVTDGFTKVDLHQVLVDYYGVSLLGSIILILLSLVLRGQRPRLGALIALVGSIFGLPYFLLTTYWSFLVALILICILPAAYLELWIPIALLCWTVVFSVRIMLSPKLDLA